jgi:hypothetical protein
MKRWISSLMLAGLAAVVVAQAPFTIVRPADGSKVREKVRILIPKNSVPPNGYVGVFLDGKLIEATRPPVEGKYHVYTLDTKGRGIKDTEPGKPVKLELVLYTETNDQSRIVDRSSVELQISNKGNIAVPNKGLSLRYRFVPGAEMVYALDQKVILSSISESQQKLGGKAAQQDVDSERIRLLYAVDNAYTDGDGLLRIQALPEKGKDYADLTTQGDLQQKRYYQNQMASIYMRITNTGREEFAALPPYVPMDGSASGVDPLSLFAIYPLPTLPAKAVRPGDSWESGFQEGKLELDKYPNIDSVTTRVRARGEFVETEWERGHPCAKIRNTIEVGDMEKAKTKALGALGQQAGTPIEDDKVSITETIWFSLDTRKVIKVVRDITIDRKSQGSAGGFGGPPGMGGPSSGPGAPGGGRPGAPGKGGGGAGIGSLLGGDLLRQGRPGGPAGFGGPSGPPGMQGGMPGPQGGRGGAPGGFGGGQGGGATMVRVRILQTFTLEK